MLIDYVTARLGEKHLPLEAWRKLQASGKGMLCIDMGTFDPRQPQSALRVHWSTTSWESHRSDSHQLVVRAGSDALWVKGSPARVIGAGDAVFGEGASRALDLEGCVARMSAFAAEATGMEIQATARDWIVSRVDVTANLMLEDLTAVRAALRVLRDAEGGRYKTSNKYTDSVYWNGTGEHKSRLLSGKAYGKGPHLEVMQSKRDYAGRRYSPDELSVANRLLRLELTIGSQFIRERIENPAGTGPGYWWQLTPEKLRELWEKYFLRMVGDMQITKGDDVPDRVRSVIDPRTGERITERTALIVLGVWSEIQSRGWQAARDKVAHASWYRALRILKSAGLGDADLGAGKVVEFRRPMITCEIVHTWDELFRKAA